MYVPEGYATLPNVQEQCNMQGAQASSEHPPQRKIDVTSKPPVGGISVVTLIRTDTTLDHSQKAEKVCLSVANMISSMLPLVHKYGSDFMLESWDMLQPLLHANRRLLVH